MPSVDFFLFNTTVEDSNTGSSDAQFQLYVITRAEEDIPVPIIVSRTVPWGT